MKNFLERHNIVHFFGMLFFTVLIMCIQTECAGAADQNADRIAKRNTLSGGIFEEDAAGIRYRKADQTYAERGWARIEGNIYYFDAKGYAKTGAFRWKKNSYRADTDGKLYVRKLYKAGSKTYYYGASGAMVKKAWKTIKGAAYYFKPNGVMARNRWVGNYYVDSAGARKKDCWVDGHYLDSTGLCVDKLTKKQIKKAGTKEERESRKRLIIIGASRVVQMARAVTGDERVIYFAKYGRGYYWFMKSAYKPLRRYLKVYPYSTVVIQLGNNDISETNVEGNFTKYAAVYKQLISDYPGVSFYFMDALPGKRGSLKNELRVQFNQKLKGEFPTQYIGGYDYMMRSGYNYRSETNTAHYDDATYRKIYKYILKKTGWKG